jgi:hypothetical protein
LPEVQSKSACIKRATFAPIALFTGRFDHSQGVNSSNSVCVAQIRGCTTQLDSCTVEGGGCDAPVAEGAGSALLAGRRETTRGAAHALHHLLLHQCLRAVVVFEIGRRIKQSCFGFRELHVLLQYRRSVALIGGFDFGWEFFQVGRIPNNGFMFIALVIRDDGFVLHANTEQGRPTPKTPFRFLDLAVNPI